MFSIALSNVVGKAIVKDGGDSWFFLTADYAFGHSLEKDTGEVVRAAGGRVAGAVRHPLATGDFSSFLLQAQSSRAKVVGLANAGGDTINAIKSANEFGLTKNQKLAGLLVFINDIHSLGLKTTQGMYLTDSWYWNQTPETRAWARRFFEKMKPYVAAAEANGVTIAIENHGNSLLHHPDSLRYFAEFNRSAHLGVALAPHHLHPWIEQLPTLIRDFGAKQIPFMYFQEHSAGISQKVAKEIELRQLPGFGGGLDYRPVIKALADIRYTGLVEIFMHPTPRGIPILPTVAEITAAINCSRDYIEGCRREVLG